MNEIPLGATGVGYTKHDLRGWSVDLEFMMKLTSRLVMIPLDYR